MGVAAPTEADIRHAAEEILDAKPLGGKLFDAPNHKIMCPKCEKWIELLAFRMLDYVDKYAHETVPVYRCPRHQCGHVFALHPNP